MSGSPTGPLMTSVYGRLNGDTALVTTLGVDVYDDVPEGATFPYVVIGEMTSTPNDTMGKTGRDVTVTVHSWSRYDGMQETNDVADRVDELLDRWLPTGLSGWSATQMLQEYFESFRDPDGRTRHGVARYRTHMHES